MGDTKVNLGSGYRKLKDFINIDNRPETNPDMLHDVTEGMPFKDESVSIVVAIDFLEHIPIGKVIPLIEEIYRVLEPGGKFISMTPSTDGRGAFQDPTHVSFWNQNSWLYYMEDRHRALYGIRAKFTGSIKDIHSENNIIHTHADLVKA